MFDGVRAHPLGPTEHDTVREDGWCELFDVFGEAIGAVAHEGQGFRRSAQREGASGTHA